MIYEQSNVVASARIIKVENMPTKLTSRSEPYLRASTSTGSFIPTTKIEW